MTNIDGTQLSEPRRLGDTVRARDIGRAGSSRYVWTACPRCHMERWQVIYAVGRLCPKCGIPLGGKRRTGTNNPRWSGGTRKSCGYTFVTVREDHPLFSMAFRVGSMYQIAEHRIVMAQHIGRVLADDEIVHHINGNKSDNRIENLQLLVYNQHHAHLVLQDLQNKYRILQSRVALLEAENVLLRSRLDDMLIPNQADVNSTNTSGVCRDLTGGISADKENPGHKYSRDGGKVHAYEKS